MILGCISPNLLNTRFFDEIISLILFLQYATFIIKNKYEINKAFIFTIIVFAFYVIYSFIKKSNTYLAVLSDAVVQFKPFIGFFCVFLLSPRLEKKHKNIFKFICFVIIIYCVIVGGLCGGIITNNYNSIYFLIGHPAIFAFCITLSALVFVFSSKMNTKNILIFFAILSVGIISGRSKFYAFYLFSILIWLYYYKKDIKIKAFDFLFFGIILIGIIIISFEKINMYFLDDESLKIMWFNSRKVLYSVSFDIANLHFPFGNGFASFGSDASGRFLSETYNQYNLIDQNGNLTIYISDAYFATILGQFGYIGIALFSFFWIYILKMIYSYSLKANDKKLFILGISIVAFFLIESFSNTTFTQNRGLEMMMLLGFVLAELKQKTLLK